MSHHVAMDGASENARRLKAMRERAGIGLRELARRVGWDASRYQYYEDRCKKVLLPREVIEMVQPYLVGRGDPPITSEELAELAGVKNEPHVAPHSNVSPDPQKLLAVTGLLPPRSEMPKDIPVLGTVSGGGGGFQMNGDAIDWARRPPRLNGRTDVFGAYVEDLSMVPAHRPGALVLCERARPPAPGDDVILDLQPSQPHEEHRTLIKHLVKITHKVVIVEQYNPPKVLEFPRRQVVGLYRVIPLNDLLGV